MSWKTFLALTLKDYSIQNKTGINPSHKFYYIIIATIIWCISIIVGMLATYMIAPHISHDISIKAITYAGLALGTVLSFALSSVLKIKVKLNSYDKRNLDFQGALIFTSIIVLTVFIPY